MEIDQIQQNFFFGIHFLKLTLTYRLNSANFLKLPILQSLHGGNKLKHRKIQKEEAIFNKNRFQRVSDIGVVDLVLLADEFVDVAPGAPAIFVGYFVLDVLCG